MQELKQNKPFEHLEEEVFLNLQRSAQALTQAIGKVLKFAELTGVQYNVLRILRGSQDTGLLCNEISERMVTKDSDITRLLDRLESSGLVMRERHLKDRRAVVTRITPRGLKVLVELDEPISLCIRKQLGHLSEKKLKKLNNLLVLARKSVK